MDLEASNEDVKAIENRKWEWTREKNLEYNVEQVNNR